MKRYSYHHTKAQRLPSDNYDIIRRKATQHNTGLQPNIIHIMLSSHFFYELMHINSLSRPPPLKKHVYKIMPKWQKNTFFLFFLKIPTDSPGVQAERERAQTAKQTL